MIGSNAEFEMRSWIRQLNGLLATGAEKQIAETNEILQAAFAYKEEIAPPKNYITVEIPEEGVTSIMKQAKLIVRGYNGVILAEGLAVLQTNNTGVSPTVIISEDMAEVISIAMDAKRKMDDVANGFGEEDPESEMDEIQDKARQFAMACFIATPQTMDYHITRWTSYCNSLEPALARPYALKAYEERLTELRDAKTSALENAMNYEEIGKKARMYAEGYYSAESRNKHIHSERFNSYCTTLAPPAVRFANAIYDKRLDELAMSEPSDSPTNDVLEANVISKARQFAEKNFNSGPDITQWDGYIQLLNPTARKIALESYNKRWSELIDEQNKAKRNEEVETIKKERRGHGD
jgi:hypothetical protein